LVRSREEAARGWKKKRDGIPAVRALDSIVGLMNYAASPLACEMRGSGTFSSLISRGMTLR
jgi:hypothetical protein